MSVWHVAVYIRCQGFGIWTHALPIFERFDLCMNSSISIFVERSVATYNNIKDGHVTVPMSKESYERAMNRRHIILGVYLRLFE